MCHHAYIKRITIRLPEDLHERLRREASEAGTSMSALIRSKLEQKSALRTSIPRNGPLDEFIGSLSDGTLTENLDEELYDLER